MGSNPEVFARVCIDIIVVAIIGLSAIMGWRRGLASVVFSCFRWMICVMAAVFGAYPAKEFLAEKTGLQDTISLQIKSSMNSSVTGNALFETLPEQVTNPFVEYQQNVSARIANSIADTIFTAVAFLLVLLVLIFVTKFFAIALSYNRKKGPIGIINSIFGGAFGLLRGVLLISIVMLALFPILGCADPRAVEPVVAGVRESFFGNLFYDHNPLIMLFEMF